MQADKEKVLSQLPTPSALENSGNQGRFSITRGRKKKKKASVISHLQGERVKGVKIHTGFRPEGNFAVGPPVHEGHKKDSECSVWISQGQILPDQPDFLQQWDVHDGENTRLICLDFVKVFDSLL